jgi:hypothetical protein
MKSDAFGSPLLQATEWQHIGNEIDTAFIFARAHFVNVLRVIALFSTAR